MASDITEWLEEHRVDVSTLAVDQIVGIGHVQAELRSIAGRLRHPEIVAAAGGDLPRGLLFHGAPGTGKSTSARWVARTIGDELPFYELAADELSATRIRAVFRTLADVRCVVFVDEIDSIGRHRDWQGPGRGQAALRALLSGLDGLVAAPGPLVIAATTRLVFELDNALTRAGRLGIHVRFEEPNETERAELLAVLSRSRSVAPDVDWAVIAARTGGSTPADLRQILDDALGIALGDDRLEVGQADLLAAVKRDGEIEPEREMPLKWDRRRCELHEGGHIAVIAALLDPGKIRRVEIGPLASMTRYVDETRPMISVPDDELRARIAVCYGGLAAERAILGGATLGSDDDVTSATHLIERMLASALSLRLPPLAFNELAGERSDRTRASYDAAVSHEADQAYELAEAIVAQNTEAISRFADAFSGVSELEGEGLAAAIAGAGFRNASGRPISATFDRTTESAA